MPQHNATSSKRLTVWVKRRESACNGVRVDEFDAAEGALDQCWRDLPPQKLNQSL